MPYTYTMVFNVGLLYYVVQRNMYQLSSKKLLTKNTMNSLYVKNEMETITDPKMVLARILKKRNIATEQNTTNKCLTLQTMDDNTNIFSIKFNTLIDEKNVQYEDGMERYAKYFILQQSDIDRKLLSTIKYADQWSY